MKRVLLLLSIIILSSGCFAQWKVKDKNKNNQWKSMEFQQWKFTPKWYYTLFHSGYRKTDKRNIKQEAPMIAASALSKAQSDKQGESTDSLYKQELSQFADKSIDYQYTLTKSNREDLIENIMTELSNYSKKGGNPENSFKIIYEVDRIRTNVTIIHESHMGNAKKREAYLGFEKELKSLHRLVVKLNILNRIKQ